MNIARCVFPSLLCAAVFSVQICHAQVTEERIFSRSLFNLDGLWTFNLSEPALSGTIRVPGAWEAQHYGQETKQMRWQVLTGDNARGLQGAVGLYQKQVSNISCPVQGSRKFLAIDHGIHRNANISVAGVHLASHTGYLTPFEVDISDYVSDVGKPVLLEINVSGGRDPSSDALMGAADDDSDGTGLGGWAGINGHVSIQCRPPLRIDSGIANTIPPHVNHAAVTVASAGKPINVSVTFIVAGGSGLPSLKIFDRNGSLVASTDSGAVSGDATLHVEVPAAQLWTPTSPHLYSAEVTLRENMGGAIVDSVSTRFGIRTISTDGHKFMLNGRRLFLNGYGDDSVYPETVAPPRSKSAYAAKLQWAHSHGFNFVRHHSHVLPDEYFEAADELGVLISPELPCIYGPFYDAAGPAGRALYVQTWRSYISRLRNHASVMDWCMCNEYSGGIPQREQLYAIAKSLDPSRLVIDADGLFGWKAGSFARGTLDFHSVQFDTGNLGSWGSLPLDKQFKYYDQCSGPACRFNSTPKVPVISHETGNFNTFPRIESLMAEFNSSGTTIKPYWLTNARQHLLSLDLLKENDAWSTATELLYAMCWKIDIEDLRRNPMISGYEWWTIQDYWTGNNGLVDTFFQEKAAAAAVVTQFNAPSVLLQDGLEFAYQSEDVLNVSLSLSNFGEADVTPSSHLVSWILQKCSASACTTIDDAVLAVHATVAQGELGFVARVAVALPDIGIVTSAGAVPATIQISASLVSLTSTRVVAENSWNATIFPKWVDGPSSGFSVTVTDAKLATSCMFNNCKLAASDYPRSVYLMTHITDPVMEAVRAGSVAVLVQQDAEGYYPSESTRFKQAWWLGSATDNNAGTFVYDDPSSIFTGMAPMRYADITWYRMMEGAQAFLLEEFSNASKPEVLVRAIDISTRSRSKALCFRMKVGKGYIIGAGLNLLQQCSYKGCAEKEKAWVLYKLLVHAGKLLSGRSADLKMSFI